MCCPLSELAIGQNMQNFTLFSFCSIVAFYSIYFIYFSEIWWTVVGQYFPVCFYFKNAITK